MLNENNESLCIFLQCVMERKSVRIITWFHLPVSSSLKLGRPITFIRSHSNVSVIKYVSSKVDTGSHMVWPQWKLIRKQCVACRLMLWHTSTPQFGNVAVAPWLWIIKCTVLHLGLGSWNSCSLLSRRYSIISLLLSITNKLSREHIFKLDYRLVLSTFYNSTRMKPHFQITSCWNWQSQLSLQIAWKHPSWYFWYMQARKLYSFITFIAY